LNVIMLNVIMLNVIMLKVVAPEKHPRFLQRLLTYSRKTFYSI
jgi:hypothetical protein